MEAGQVIKGPSSLKLSPVVGLENRDILQISNLATDAGSQNAGHATELMKEVCRRADLSRFMLMLEPQPFGKRALDAAQLEAWYAKFGFERIQSKPVLMAREPQDRRYDIESDEMTPVSAAVRMMTERMQ